MTSQDETLKQINRSGFPFQLRVEHEILATQPEHGWSVASREHPWVSAEQAASGFIDIVLQHNPHTTFRLVIECKRMKADDARQLRWVFLLPDQELKETALASCFEVLANRTRIQSEGDSGNESTWEDVRVWEDVSLTPNSLQSEFCILQSDDSRRQPILESLAAEVLESVEGIAQEEISVAKTHDFGSSLRLFIFPVIVTNAELAVCRFNSDRIAINDGTLDSKDVEISTVPFIRFRKSLATAFPQEMVLELGEANQARQRTVFIVNASSLPEFLKGWQLTTPAGGFAAQRLLQKRGQV